MDLNVSNEERIFSGKKFQTEEAAYEKERRPLAESIRGTTSKFFEADLRFLVGACTVIKSLK